MGNSEKESLANQAGYEVIVRHLLIIIGGSEYEKLFSYYFYFHHVAVASESHFRFVYGQTFR